MIARSDRESLSVIRMKGKKQRVRDRGPVKASMLPALLALLIR